MAEAGLETVAKTRGKTQFATEAAHNAAQLAGIGDDGLAELVALWSVLDDPSQADLLATARRLANREAI